MNEETAARDAAKREFQERLKQVKWYEALAACWPIVLLPVGGAIGGALGGLACAMNYRRFASTIPKSRAYLYALLTGVGSIVMYVIIVVLLTLAFPGLVRKP